MTDLFSRLDQLSPAKRALLEKLAARGAALPATDARRAAAEDAPVPAPAGPVREAPAAPRPMPRGDAAPLSFAQERLWFLDRLQPGETAYHVAYRVRVGGALDAAALGRALSGVAARHEALRTVFEERGDGAVQVVAPPAPVPLPRVDLSRLRHEARERTARALAREDAARPFDLRRGPLLRAALLRLDGGEHALLLTLHHVVTDGWSMGVLFRELSALYAAAVGEGEAALPPLPLQYADFAVWQRLRLRPGGGTLERELDFWRARLAGAPPVLELPADHPRAPAGGRRGGQVELAVPAATAAALRRLGRAEGTTPFITLLAAFQLLLARYAGQDDVVVGTPIAGRTHRELEGLVGFFVNSLAVRVDVSGDPTFRTLLRRTREAVLGAFAHQEVPFERLVEELQPERSPGRSPVFQALFTLHGGDAPGPRLPGARTEVEEVWSGRAKFDVSVALRDGGGALAGTFAYDAGLFERATAERMAAHFVALLGAAADAPGERVSMLSLVDEAERRRLEAWNDTARGGPDALAHEMFARQAARTPDAPAVACGAERMSYAQLDAASNRIARALREMGVRAESRVAVCLEPSVEMVAAVLGVLRAGGAYVPLDPEYPAERLRLVLEDAAPRVLLSRASPAARLPARGPDTLLLDRDAARIAAQDAGPVEGGAGPDSLAYVIYTSGSTGTPKGVLVEHRGLSGLLRAAREELGFREGDAAAALASFAFDIWGFETLAPLAAGGAVRLVPRERVMDVGALLEECRDATLLHAVPALMRRLVDAGPGALPAARRLFVGGDVVPPELLEAMRAVFPRAEVRVLYGPTEATVLASSHPLADGPVPARPVIGRPLGDARLYVAGGAGEWLPAGIPGELLIGGAGVARGYLGRPGLTAEKFVPDAFSGTPGARLYRTGDRVRLRTDGTLEFLGRVDFQVKIRGFRIEPGEVEAALLRHPEVRDSAVVAREDRPGEPRLVAYVVPEPGAAPARDALRAWLRERLPEHMVPGALVVVDALPRTPEGKTDRRALPAPDSAPDDPAESAPRTPEEEILAGIWAEVLGVERVGIHDDFFQLGGHSLLATRVVSRVRALLGAELPLRALFESPTVAGIAAGLRSHGGAAAPPLLPAPRGRPLPLSFSQQRLWFLDRMEPVNAHHNIPFALRLRGPLDAGALGRALAEVLRRHEALRTVFREDDAGPVQVVLPADGFRLPVVELGGLPEAARERAMRERAEAELGRPVDLEAGPLMRAALLRMGRGEHVLLLMVHHAAGDAWSFGVLYRELSRLYAAFLAGRPSPLPPLAVQYGDYAAWQRAHLRDATLERQVAFWRGRLEGAPPLLELPTDRPRPALQTHRAGEVAFALPAAPRSRLRELDRREGVTPFMTFLAALAVLLRRLSGQDDVVVGTPIAGRTRAETEGLIGFFVNMLALRTDLSGDPSFRELLGRVREATLGAYAHQDVPFEKLLEELRIQRSLGHASVYQVSMVLHNADVGMPELEGVRASRVELKTRTTPFDLTLVVAEKADGGMRGSLIYNADLFDEATAAAHAALLRAVLEDAAARPDAPISTIAPVLEEERALQLERWSATAPALPSHRPVHHLLREAALRAPDAPAVAQEGAAALSHADLHRRADALARRLTSLGVAPETRVALCLERSPQMLVAVLAVLKSGGCYVP
ncbi:MAG: amino acid adenylation domain-containing protein, partial [Longimicrobiaceae bacterium]